MKNDKDEALLEALDRLAKDAPEDGGLAADPAVDREVRDVLAMMPYALEPQAPRPEAKAELMAKIAATSTTAAPAEEAGSVVDMEAFRSRRSSGGLSWWQLAAAAVLGGCIVSLGFLSLQLAEQNALIASLQEEVQAARDHSRLHDNFAVVSAIAPQIYPVRRAPGSKVAANGVIYVCPKHQQWSLSMTELKRPPEDQEYVFWFVTDDGPVRAGTLQVPPQGPAVLEADSMPEGTRSFRLTLEDQGTHELPEGEVLLLAEEAIKL